MNDVLNFANLVAKFCLQFDDVKAATASVGEYNTGTDSKFRKELDTLFDLMQRLIGTMQQRSIHHIQEYHGQLISFIENKVLKKFSFVTYKNQKSY
jgi:hypothetical protein